jgi:D-inositol-3-phosphate glycosyltransferase
VPLVLFAGRLQPLKRVEVALAVVDELEKAQLVVVGGPSGPRAQAYRAGLEDEVDRRGLRDRVHFVDPQPHELLSSYYRAADVCLVPSRSESFGLVALEAAACGTPVVAAAVGGLTTLVDDGRTGLLVDDDAPSAFAAAVRHVLEDSLLAEQMATAAVVRARGYTWGRSAAVLRATYEELAVGALVECR